MAAMPGMMSKLKLTVNEERTRLCLLPEESFDPPPRLYDGQEPTLTLCLWAESRTEAYPGKTKTTRRTPDQRTENRAIARSAHSGPSGAGSRVPYRWTCAASESPLRASVRRHEWH
jgi:hypothetical protein